MIMSDFNGTNLCDYLPNYHQFVTTYASLHANDNVPVKALNY